MQPKIDLADTTFTITTFRARCADDSYVMDNGDSEHPGVNKNAVMRDLHRLLVAIDGTDPIYVVKEYNDVIDKYVYKLSNEEGGRRLLSSINLNGWWTNKSGKWVHPTVWDIFTCGSYKNSFMKDGFGFYSTNPNVFSTFNGWKWQKLTTVNKDIIKQWKEYVLRVICSDNKDLAERIHQWIAYPLQNPGKRNGVALFIHGLEGCGKTVFTDVVGELYKGYALPNINNPDVILGRFNDSRENQVLIVLNEAKQQDSVTNKIDMDAIKSPITDRTFQLESKGMKPRQVINTNNFIIATNHQNALRLTSDDRRFQVIEVSDKYINNTSIMEPFWDTNWNDELFNSLFTYYMTMDLSKYKPSTIIKTTARDEIIESGRSPYELFIREKAERVNMGVVCAKLYSAYKQFCEDNGFKCGSINQFGAGIKQFCVKKRQGSGERKEYYKLKDEYIKPFIEDLRVTDEPNKTEEIDVDIP